MVGEKRIEKRILGRIQKGRFSSAIPLIKKHGIEPSRLPNLEEAFRKGIERISSHNLEGEFNRAVRIALHSPREPTISADTYRDLIIKNLEQGNFSSARNLMESGEELYKEGISIEPKILKDSLFSGLGEKIRKGKYWDAQRGVLLAERQAIDLNPKNVFEEHKSDIGTHMLQGNTSAGDFICSLFAFAKQKGSPPDSAQIRELFEKTIARQIIWGNIKKSTSFLWDAKASKIDLDFSGNQELIGAFHTHFGKALKYNTSERLDQLEERMKWLELASNANIKLDQTLLPNIRERLFREIGLYLKKLKKDKASRHIKHANNVGIPISIEAVKAYRRARGELKKRKILETPLIELEAKPEPKPVIGKYSVRGHIMMGNLQNAEVDIPVVAGGVDFSGDGEVVSKIHSLLGQHMENGDLEKADRWQSIAKRCGITLDSGMIPDIERKVFNSVATAKMDPSIPLPYGSRLAKAFGFDISETALKNYMDYGLLPGEFESRMQESGKALVSALPRILQEGRGEKGMRKDIERVLKAIPFQGAARRVGWSKEAADKVIKRAKGRLTHLLLNNRALNEEQKKRLKSLLYPSQLPECAGALLAVSCQGICSLPAASKGGSDRKNRRFFYEALEKTEHPEYVTLGMEQARQKIMSNFLEAAENVSTRIQNSTLPLEQEEIDWIKKKTKEWFGDKRFFGKLAASGAPHQWAWGAAHLLLDMSLGNRGFDIHPKLTKVKFSKVAKTSTVTLNKYSKELKEAFGFKKFDESLGKEYQTYLRRLQERMKEK